VIGVSMQNSVALPVYSPCWFKVLPINPQLWWYRFYTNSSNFPCYDTFCSIWTIYCTFETTSRFPIWSEI